MADETTPAIGTSSKVSLKNPAELALEIYNILFPFASDVRLKAIRSAMTSLGEVAAPDLGAVAEKSDQVSKSQEGLSDLGLGVKALKWVQKYGLTRGMLDEVFHFRGDKDIDISAASVPGGTKLNMTVNCYLLTGACALLKKDSAAFDDSEAIAVCKRLAAYDKNNHTTNRGAVGNKMSGPKPSFTLTGPGEQAAAELIKEMTTGSKGK